MNLWIGAFTPRDTQINTGGNMVKEQKLTRSGAKATNARKESFQYQMDLLKMEIQTIDNIIARMDGMAQATKNWAIGIWTGSLAITLSQPELRKFVIVSAVTPILFWYVDAYFRRLQTRSIFRSRKISEFLNSHKLVESFQNNKLVDFTIFDTTGVQYRGMKEYKEFASLRRTLNFREVRDFYWVLIIISVVMGVFFLLNP
jgi:hypothetical protein